MQKILLLHVDSNYKLLIKMENYKEEFLKIKTQHDEKISAYRKNIWDKNNIPDEERTEISFNSKDHPDYYAIEWEFDQKRAILDEPLLKSALYKRGQRVHFRDWASETEFQIRVGTIDDITTADDGSGILIYHFTKVHPFIPGVEPFAVESDITEVLQAESEFPPKMYERHFVFQDIKLLFYKGLPQDELEKELARKVFWFTKLAIREAVARTKTLEELHDYFASQEAAFDRIMENLRQ